MGYEIFIYIFLVTTFAVFVIILNHFASREIKKKFRKTIKGESDINLEEIKSSTYECGKDTIGDARSMIDVKFYLVGIMFVLFDIAAVFLIPWAVNIREFGQVGIGTMLIFIGLLFVGLIYSLTKEEIGW